jgi:diguanylate cyclase (GGDEF)-like protein
MSLLPFRGFRSAIGVRTMGQFVALALAPVAAVAVLLYAQQALTPALRELLQIVAAVAVVVAVVMAAIQSEFTLRRLERLIDSTRRIAKQDFAVAMPVQGSDEVSDLTRAFNEMARHLGVSLSVQGILAQMDDAVLTKLDVGALIRSALRCLRLVTLADVVVLGLFESDTADAMRIFTIRKGERNRIDSQKLEMSAELKRRIPLTPTRKTAPDFEARLREENGIGHYFALPISRGSRAWGVMVSCHQAQTELSSSQLKMLSGVANRLIAGFSGAERDEKLHSLAYVDPLTGLPNRVAMQSLLTQQLANSASTKTMTAILFIDLDRFKQANDTHGHAFGDRLLVQAANRIRNHVREDDVVARIGGDEFTVILPDVKTPREAGSVARKLIQSLSRRFEIDGHTIYTGASVGIAMYPDDGVGGPELLKMADTAMYRAKSAGRSRFAFYEEPMNAESKRRSVLDGELRNALERKELVLHYQPQIDLKTGALCGVEALVRWQHPTRGLLYPNDFIAYAEEIGLIPEIGAWVMGEACQQYQRWREEGVRVPRVSVNVSNGQLPRSNFVPTVRALIEATRMPPEALEIEVTESMLVEGGKPAIEALKQLAAEGVLIAIDDFGTGYSSFSYLKTMPARVLKLDMSFLVDARLENDAGKIVAAIINMAHALQKEVVAEGVELVEQLKLLKALGCERGQGYLFGKAVPPAHISRTFRRIPEAEAAAIAAPALPSAQDPDPAAPQPPMAVGAPPATLDIAMPAMLGLPPPAQAQAPPAATPFALSSRVMDAIVADIVKEVPLLNLADEVPEAAPDEAPGPLGPVHELSLLPGLDALPVALPAASSVAAAPDPEPDLIAAPASVALAPEAPVSADRRERSERRGTPEYVPPADGGNGIEFSFENAGERPLRSGADRRGDRRPQDPAANGIEFTTAPAAPDPAPPAGPEAAGAEPQQISLDAWPLNGDPANPNTDQVIEAAQRALEPDLAPGRAGRQ